VSTIGFPIAFTAASVVKAVMTSLTGNDRPFGTAVADGLVWGIALALLVWPAHALVNRWMSRSFGQFEIAQQFVYSAVIGVVAFCAPLVAGTLVPIQTSGVTVFGVGATYWVAAGCLTVVPFMAWRRRGFTARDWSDGQ
jgi:hypothetical protein